MMNIWKLRQKSVRLRKQQLTETERIRVNERDSNFCFLLILKKPYIFLYGFFMIEHQKKITFLFSMRFLFYLCFLFFIEFFCANVTRLGWLLRRFGCRVAYLLLTKKTPREGCLFILSDFFIVCFLCIIYFVDFFSFYATTFSFGDYTLFYFSCVFDSGHGGFFRMLLRISFFLPQHHFLLLAPLCCFMIPSLFIFLNRFFQIHFAFNDNCSVARWCASMVFGFSFGGDCSKIFVATRRGISSAFFWWTSRFFLPVSPVNVSFRTVRYPKIVSVVPSDGSSGVLVGIEDPITVALDISAEDFYIDLSLDPPVDLYFQREPKPAVVSFLPKESLQAGVSYNVRIVARHRTDVDDGGQEIYSGQFATLVIPDNPRFGTMEERLQRARLLASPKILDGKYIHVDRASRGHDTF